jgi:predicted nucleotidyltransferase
VAIPEFTVHGELPPALHPATLTEVIERFGSGSKSRETAAKDLLRIVELARSTGQLDRVIVFGSFVTSKTDPNDVDVILIMKDEFRLESCPAPAARLFDHAEAQARHGASVFWIRPSLLIHDTLEQFIARWQLTREGRLRGIVEVIE